MSPLKNEVEKSKHRGRRNYAATRKIAVSNDGGQEQEEGGIHIENWMESRNI